MIDDIDDIIGGGISRKGIENALKKFNFNFDRTVDYLLDMKDKKTQQPQTKPEPKVQEKTSTQNQKPQTNVVRKSVSALKSVLKENDEPLIVERKPSRKMSKEMILEKPLDKSTWNKLYPIINYSK